MNTRWLIAAAIAGSLAVPVAASAHPLESNLGVFSGQMPELNLLEAEAGRDYFRGTPPSEYDKTDNMRFVGFSARPAAGNLSLANSDIAFQGDRAYQGTFPGFRIIDISNASKPKELVNYTDCRHPSGQGDVVIYGDIMTRSWDSASSVGMPAGGWPCGDTRVQAGEEGLHVIDVGNPAEPDVEAFIDLPCGSHTASGVPDPANDRLIIYSTPSNGNCDGIDIIEIPTGDPSAASYHHFDAAADLIACHDTGVILGEVLKAACAGGQGFAVWSMASEDGGSLIDPKLLYTKNVKTTEGININTGHSAAFSNDGETLIFGHEPNGGTSARCQATGTVLNNPTYPVQTDDMKSFFFFDVATGELQSKWTLPRDQSAFENCTLHNYNVVPSKNRDILVHGSYQSGIGVVDFSDLDDIREIAYADPEPLNPTALSVGGDWSSHYYNGLIWQSDITRGLLAWQIRGDALGGTQRLDRLNPQTQEFTTSG
jgi:LVIVD repeat